MFLVLSLPPMSRIASIVILLKTKLLKILYSDYLGKEIESNFVFKSITIDAILDIGGKLKTKNIVG